MSTTTRLPAPASTPAAVDPAVDIPVPWATVLAFGLVLAYADGLVVVVLRGTVGSILRTDAPFTTWVRESALVAPAYVAVVLAVVTWAQRHRGAELRGTRAVTATLGSLVVAAGGVGVLWTAASAVYDYRLQTGEMRDMPAMIASCDAECRTGMDAATAALQARAVLVGAVLLLVVNLVAVLWLHALRGGTLVAPRARAAAAASSTPRDGARLLVGTALLGAAAVHLAVVPEHLAEWPAAGTFFVVLTAAEVATAVLVLRGRGGLGPVAAVAVSLGPLVLWAWSRFVGLPLGPEPGETEAVGVADLAADVLELVSLVGALVLLARAHRAEVAQRPRWAGARALPVVVLVAVTTLGLGGTGLPWLHSFGVDAGHDHGADSSASPSP